MRFSKYDFDDIVEAQYRLVTEHLAMDRSRLKMGASMGGRHAGNLPKIADAITPLVGLPVEKWRPSARRQVPSYWSRRPRTVACFVANDMIYAFESSRYFARSLHLGRIRGPLLAINSANNQANPHELGAIKRDPPRPKRTRWSARSHRRDARPQQPFRFRKFGATPGRAACRDRLRAGASSAAPRRGAECPSE